MAITPGFKTNAEGEEEYIDKGAVMTPQINPMVDAKYAEGKRKAAEADYVEWPTKVHADDEGM
jgi:hypothetical protein